MGENLSGKALATILREEIKEYTRYLQSQGKDKPCLLSIQVGEDKGSEFYINNQKKLSEELGIEYIKKAFKGDTSEETIIKFIHEANENENIHGIIVQLPLPKEINLNKVLSTISSEKDVDGQSDANISRLYKNEEGFVPCTAESVLRLVKTCEPTIEGKKAVVLGRSTIVGKPVAHLLLKENATVAICHSKSRDLKSICREADILVSAIGKPNFVNEDYIKPGAVVIDVGTSSYNGKITGDIDYDKVITTAGYVTPVPGGVGALTTTILLNNVCKVYRKNAN